MYEMRIYLLNNTQPYRDDEDEGYAGGWFNCPVDLEEVRERLGVENEERFIKDGVVEDDYRIEFVTEHLKWLHKGIEEGSNCLGYLMWTPIDCWSYRPQGRDTLL